MENKFQHAIKTKLGTESTKLLMSYMVDDSADMELLTHSKRKDQTTVCNKLEARLYPIIIEHIEVICEAINSAFDYIKDNRDEFINKSSAFRLVYVYNAIMDALKTNHPNIIIQLTRVAKNNQKIIKGFEAAQIEKIIMFAVIRGALKECGTPDMANLEPEFVNARFYRTIYDNPNKNKPIEIEEPLRLEEESSISKDDTDTVEGNDIEVNKKEHLWLNSQMTNKDHEPKEDDTIDDSNKNVGGDVITLDQVKKKIASREVEKQTNDPKFYRTTGNITDREIQPKDEAVLDMIENWLGERGIILNDIERDALNVLGSDGEYTKEHVITLTSGIVSIVCKLIKDDKTKDELFNVFIPMFGINIPDEIIKVLSSDLLNKVMDIMIDNSESIAYALSVEGFRETVASLKTTNKNIIEAFMTKNPVKAFIAIHEMKVSDDVKYAFAKVMPMVISILKEVNDINNSKSDDDNDVIGLIKATAAPVIPIKSKQVEPKQDKVHIEVAKKIDEKLESNSYRKPLSWYENVGKVNLSEMSKTEKEDTFGSSLNVIDKFLGRKSGTSMSKVLSI